MATGAAAVWLGYATDLTCADSTQAHWVDVEHQPTDLAVVMWCRVFP